MVKILSWVFGVLLVIAIVFGGQTLYSKWKLQNINDQLNQQLMKSNLEIGKAKSQFGNAQKKIDELDTSLRIEIEKNNELLIAYGELEVKYNATSGGTGTGTVAPGSPIKRGEDFKPGQWYVAVTESNLVGVNEITIDYNDFRLDISSVARPGKEWENYYTKTRYNLNLKFFGQIVQSTTKSGAINHYLNLWELDNQNRKIRKLELERFEVVVQKPNQPEWFLFAPHVDIGVFLGLNTSISFSGGATLGLTTSGYGLTKNDLSWKFVRIGADVTDEAIGLSFSPVQYRVSDLLPLVSNLYIGPYGSIFTDGKKSLGLILTVEL